MELKFEEHISKKVNVANAIAGQIRRSFTYLDAESFKKLYTSFVRPHIEYAQSVWAPHLSKYINTLENVQVRATRSVDGFEDLDYPERLRLLDLPTLKYRRQQGDMIEVFKHFHTYDKTTISPSFQPRARKTRRHNYQLYERRPKDGVRGLQYNSFYYRTARLWIELPEKVVNAKDIDTFKKLLDNHWENEPSKYDHKYQQIHMNDS